MNASECLTIHPSNENFAYWRSRPYVTSRIKEVIEKANFLILPLEGLRDGLPPAFVKGTLAMYDFLKSRSSEEFRPDLCMSDEEYLEIEFNHSIIDFGLFIADKIVLPLALSALWDYIKHLAKKSQPIDIVKVTIIEELPTGAARSIHYEGKPENFEVVFKDLLNAPQDTILAEIHQEEE